MPSRFVLWYQSAFTLDLDRVLIIRVWFGYLDHGRRDFETGHSSRNLCPTMICLPKHQSWGNHKAQLNPNKDGTSTQLPQKNNAKMATYTPKEWFPINLWNALGKLPSQSTKKSRKKGLAIDWLSLKASQGPSEFQSYTGKFWKEANTQLKWTPDWKMEIGETDGYAKLSRHGQFTTVIAGKTPMAGHWTRIHARLKLRRRGNQEGRGNRRGRCSPVASAERGWTTAAPMRTDRCEICL